MRILLLFLAICFSPLVNAQESDLQLSQFYYSKGDFDKALPYLEKIYKKEPNKYNFKRYYNCLLELGDKKEAEKVLKKQATAANAELEYQLMYGELLEKEGKAKEATKIYQSLIQNNASSSLQVEELALLFNSYSKSNYALEVLEKGRKNLKGYSKFQSLFAETYLKLGQKEKALQEYISLLGEYGQSQEEVQVLISKNFDIYSSDQDAEMLKNKLLELINKNPNHEQYNRLLIWYFTQKKLFGTAINQAKAYNKRTHGNGQMIYEIAVMCIENKDYEAALPAFEYLFENGETQQYRNDAQFWILRVQYLEITENKNFDHAYVSRCIGAHENALKSMNRDAYFFKLVLQMAEIKAYYADRSQEAIADLLSILSLPNLTQTIRAEVKIALADIYVLVGDVWEASLLYMQVDTEFKFEPVGHEAKYKNARVFYYDGDFAFAQSQLDVLKQSTSKLIANDAMQLSILITDNYGLDSNYTAMSKFAQADLLLAQHKYDAAFVLYDSILKLFPYHALSDEILFRKGGAMEEQGKWSEALGYYQELLKYHAEDILADDALMRIAVIYEEHLHNLEEAAVYYRKLVFDYKDSLYGADARKKIRSLRGEKVED